MIDTNLLVAFALSIVANFTNVVPVPPLVAPQTTNDLEVCWVGRRYFPLDVYLKSKHGGQFWIANGIVNQYSYQADMYFGLQDPRRIPEFVGIAKLTSNQVFQLADRTVRGLVKNGDPLKGITPIIKSAKPCDGKTVPYYDIKWPDPAAPHLFYKARVQVNARTGYIVSLSADGEGFRDPVYFQEISNRVYKTPFPEFNPLSPFNPTTNRPSSF